MSIRKYLFMLPCILLFAACGGGKEEADKPVITVTIEPLRYFTEAVAGDNFQVVSMVPEGSNPETYDPTPQQLVNLSQSKAYFRIGHIGFEQAWMEKLKSNAPNLPFYDMSEGVELIDSPHPHIHAQAADPHIWNSIPNARIIAENIYRALCRLDNGGRTYYQHRLDSLKNVIDRTEEHVVREMAEADRAFVIYHPALSYFARDYGLEQICIEAEGKEPSPAYLQQLIRRCREKQVRIVFVQQEFDRRNAELIAGELSLELVTVNPLSYRWDEEMMRIADALSRKPNKR